MRPVTSTCLVVWLVLQAQLPSALNVSSHEGNKTRSREDQPTLHSFPHRLLPSNHSNASSLSANESSEAMQVAALSGYADGNDVMSKLLASEKGRTMFSGMSAKLKEAFEKMDLSALSVQEITQVPAQLWRRVNNTDLASATREQMGALVKHVGEMNDIATLIRIVTAARNKLPLEQYISQIESFSENVPAKVKALLTPILHRLGEPDAWKNHTVEMLNRNVLYVPAHQLTRVKNREAVEKVVEIYKKTVFPTGQKNQLRVQPMRADLGLQATIRRMLVEKHGNLSDWSFTLIIEHAQLLPDWTPFELDELDEREVLKSLTALSAVEFRDRGHAQPILQKIFHAKDFSSMSSGDFTEFLKKLNLLEKYVTFLELMKPLEIFFQKPNGRRITEYLKPHLTTSQDNLLGQYLYRRSETGSWSNSNQLKAAGFLLQYAGPDSIKILADKDLLNKYTLEVIAGAPRLERGLIFLLRQLINRYFNFRLSSFPAAFLPMIESEEMAQKMNPNDVQRYFSKINQQIPTLNMAQKAQIISKLQQKDFTVSHQIDTGLAWMIAPHDILRLKANVQPLLTVLSPESPQVQLYNEKKLADASLTVKDLTDSPHLVGAMTTQMVQTIHSDDVVEILVAVNQSPFSPRPKVMKYLANLLREYLQTVDNISSSDDINLVQALRDSEVELVGGHMMSQFRRAALHDLLPDQCVGVFTAIGRLTPDKLNLIQPPKKRLDIAKDALYCLKPDAEYQSLNLSDVTVLGYLLGYLPSYVIDDMSQDVFLHSLPWLQGIGSEPWANPLKVQPCFTEDMHNAIRNKLVAVFGSPTNWTEPKLWTAGCLLTNLFQEDLDILNPELLFLMERSLTQCPWNRRLPSRIEEARLHLLQDQCGQVMESQERLAISEGSKRLERKLAEAVTIASRHLDKLMLPDRRKRNGPAEINVLSCDALRLTRGALDLNEGDLKNLPILELEPCLERLGSHPLPKSTAETLWKQINEAYGGADKVPADMLLQLGHIAVAMTTDDIELLNLTSIDVIATLGVIEGFEEDQLIALANATKSHLRTNVRVYSGADLMSLGYILCGYTEEDVRRMPDNAYSNASAVLSFLHPCRTPVLKSLAKKALKLFGEAPVWTVATLTNVGAVLGGLAPEEINSIPNSSFEGITRAGARSLPPDSLKTLTTGQLQSFSVEGALSLTEEQKSHFVKEQREALASVYLTPGDASATKVSALTGMIIAVTVSVLVRYFWIGPS